MQLDEVQRKKVAEWVNQGLKLSEIQNRLRSELGLALTYMDVRMLVDDLKLVPKDPEAPKTPASTSPLAAGAAAGGRAATAQSGQATADTSKGPAPGRVSVSVDQIARPGAVVSGKVTFSDGNRAEWYFDQAGRLGLASQQAGYRPPQADLQEFQAALDAELSKLGF